MHIYDLYYVHVITLMPALVDAIFATQQTQTETRPTYSCKQSQVHVYKHPPTILICMLKFVSKTNL